MILPDKPLLLQAKGVTVEYPLPTQRVVAAEDVDFSIERGEILGIVGETGSGKSTAALAMAGLVRPPGVISRGEITFCGRDLLSMTARELNGVRGQEISIILQNPRAALNPVLNVGRQISYAIRAHQQVDRRSARARAVELLDMVGISDPNGRASAYPHELSGGMAQRVVIAIAIANQPQLIIADEPTTGLDVTVQAQILDLLQLSAREVGSSVLLVTHDLGVVAHYCDRFAVMHAGRVVEEGPTKTIFLEPQHPYTRDLLNATPERSGKGNFLLSTLKEHTPQ